MTSSIAIESHEMTARDVVDFVQMLEQHQIGVCIDGGWAVDALLGVQTRRHADLDIAVEHVDVPKIRALLERIGYSDVPRDDTRDCNFVMGDIQGHEIDFHSFTFDANGKLVFGLDYPPDSLHGSGSVDGFPVRCITPDWLVKFHCGYAFDENDFQDVKALCQHFDIEMPAEYVGFEQSNPVADRSGSRYSPDV